MLHVVSDDDDENFSDYALFYIHPLNNNYKLGNCGGSQTQRLRNSSNCSLSGIFIFITNVDAVHIV
jgi:hypothetical protein